MNFINKKYLKICRKIVYIILAIILVIPSTLLLTTINTKQAHAYQIPKIKSWKTQINAQIATNGSINVSELKIIDISKFIDKAKRVDASSAVAEETNKGINLQPMVWNFNSFPEESWTSISDIKYAALNEKDAVVNNWTTVTSSKFLEKWHGNDGPDATTYAYDDDARQLCLYCSLTNEDQYTDNQAFNIASQWFGTTDKNVWTNKAIINLNYTINCAPHAYKDVADFNWIYVSDSWVNDSYNVNLSVTVPVGSESISHPIGKETNLDQNSDETTERNIYAWGHGSSTGIVNLDPNGIVTLKNDIVPGGSDAGVRIVFPSAWLTNIDPKISAKDSSHTKLVSILKEESVWRDWRTEHVNKLLVPLIFVGFCAISLIVIFIVTWNSKRKFLNKSITVAKLSDIHPSVLLRMKNWNREHEHDIVASLLYMHDLNLIKLTRLPSGDFAINLKDSSLAKNPYKNKKLDIIDIRTINFLFRECACGTSRLSLQDILNYARARSYNFITAYLTWHSLLTDQVNNIISFKSGYDKQRNILFIYAACLFIISALLGIYFLDWITPVSGSITGLVIAFVANSLRNNMYFIDEDGNKVPAEDVKIGLKDYTKEVDEFKNKSLEKLHQSVLDAQDNISKYNLNN